MTRDDIIELALQCGIWIPIARGPERALTIHKLCRLATLVAAAERDALRAAVRHEADCVEACKSEIERLATKLEAAEKERDALRAKIETMEKQGPVATVRINAINGNPSVDFIPGHSYLHHNDKLYLASGAQSVPDVDALAQFIREIDGKHQLGAGALAERIVEWLAADPEAKP